MILLVRVWQGISWGCEGMTGYDKMIKMIQDACVVLGGEVIKLEVKSDLKMAVLL